MSHSSSRSAVTVVSSDGDGDLCLVQEVSAALTEYEEVCSEAAAAGVDLVTKQFTNNWDYIQSCFFALTILTTIGNKQLGRGGYIPPDDISPCCSAFGCCLSMFHPSSVQVTGILLQRHSRADFSVCFLALSEYRSCCRCWRMLAAFSPESSNWPGTKTRPDSCSLPGSFTSCHRGQSISYLLQLSSSRKFSHFRFHQDKHPNFRTKYKC